MLKGLSVLSRKPMKNWVLPLQIMGLSSFVTFVLFAWQGNIGFNLWDEGFLWYGAQRVMLGEVPIRDFMSYDPGRYYWSAAIMGLLGDNGIMNLRVAAAIFQALGLSVGLFLIARAAKSINKHNILYLLLSAATLMLWMFPRYKLFDTSLSIFLIGILTFLVENPSGRGYFITGVCIGLLAVFGRNHGIYGVVGCLGVMIWLRIKRTEGLGVIKGGAFLAAGATVGFAPIFLMALIIPGFALAFWDSIRFLSEVKTTNLFLPIPWPWRVHYTSVPVGDAIRGLLVGLFFIGTFVFGVLSILWVGRQKFQNKSVSPALVAASFLAFPYTHYAYSRADVDHLALGIFPLLVGCLVFLSMQPSKVKWPLALMLGIASLWVMYIFHPGWQCYASKQYMKVEISGSELKLDPGTVSNIVLLRQLAAKYAPDGQSFLVAPFWPGAYALLQRKSPMWENFAFFPRPKAFEQAEIERIKAAKPGFAFILDLPLDGREELRFRNTKPLIHQYILDNFELLPDSSSPTYQIYKTKRGVQ